jgi:hypothetical protein
MKAGMGKKMKRRKQYTEAFRHEALRMVEVYRQTAILYEKYAPEYAVREFLLEKTA